MSSPGRNGMTLPQAVEVVARLRREIDDLGADTLQRSRLSELHRQLGRAVRRVKKIEARAITTIT